MEPVMMKEILEEADILGNVLKQNEPVFKEIAREFKDRNIRFVIIAGRGTSDHAAVYAKYLFEAILKKPVALAAPSISTIFDAKLDIGRDTMVIGISQSGCAQDVDAVLKDARSTGSLTIAITNAADSLLSQTAEYDLNCYAGLEKSVAATKTFSATLQIIAGIVAFISEDTALVGQLANIGEWIRKVYDLRPSIESMAKKYKGLDECIVLSRGYTYPIALEMTLKLEECAYINASALSISDFMHGPIAMINQGAKCFLIADKGPFMKQYLELYDILATYGADTLMLTNDESVIEGRNTLFLPDCESSIAQPLIYITAIQIFVCLLSIYKGLDPDVPRNLRKVTITR